MLDSLEVSGQHIGAREALFVEDQPQLCNPACSRVLSAENLGSQRRCEILKSLASVPSQGETPLVFQLFGARIGVGLPQSAVQNDDGLLAAT